jgi:putative alpha-1,2-mannosidase
VRHSELISGATLTFTMGDQPNHQLGADQKVAPPSLTT